MYELTVLFSCVVLCFWVGGNSYQADVDLKKLAEEKDVPKKEQKKAVRKTFQDR